MHALGALGVLESGLLPLSFPGQLLESDGSEARLPRPAPRVRRVGSSAGRVGDIGLLRVGRPRQELPGTGYPHKYNDYFWISHNPRHLFRIQCLVALRALSTSSTARPVAHFHQTTPGPVLGRFGLHRWFGEALAFGNSLASPVPSPPPHRDRIAHAHARDRWSFP